MGRLWSHQSFVKLLAGQTVSSFGSQITLVAGPLVAALTLHVGPVQMGLLRATAVAPGLVFGFGAGAWADRMRRRPLMIAADLVRATALATVPAAALLGVLHVSQLYIVFAVTAVATTAFGTAYPAYLPVLVDQKDILAANARLRLSGEVARTAGPTLGGALVQAFTGPVAIAVDAGTFLLSALSLATIRSREPRPMGPGPTQSLRSVPSSIGQGLRCVIGDPLLRALAGAAGLFDFFDGVIFAVYVLYVTRVLHLSPFLLGAIFTAGGVGGVVGALVVGRLSRHIRIGLTLVGALVLAAAGELLIPFAGGSTAVATVLLMLAEVIVGIGATVWGISSVALRQTHMPLAYQGRVHAIVYAIEGGFDAAGAIAGGFLAQVIGMRSSLIVGAVGTLVAVLWLLVSPVRSASLARDDS